MLTNQGPDWGQMQGYGDTCHPRTWVGRPPARSFSNPTETLGASALGQQRALLHAARPGRLPAYLIGHRVLVRVPLLATLVFVNRGHDLQDVVVGGEGCGKDTAE